MKDLSRPGLRDAPIVVPCFHEAHNLFSQHHIHITVDIMVTSKIAKVMQFIWDKSDNTECVQYCDISSYPRVTTTISVWIQFDKDKIRYKILVGFQRMVT